MFWTPVASGLNSPNLVEQCFRFIFKSCTFMNRNRVLGRWWKLQVEVKWSSLATNISFSFHLLHPVQCHKKSARLWASAALWPRPGKMLRWPCSLLIKCPSPLNVIVADWLMVSRSSVEQSSPIGHCSFRVIWHHQTEADVNDHFTSNRYK